MTGQLLIFLFDLLLPLLCGYLLVRTGRFSSRAFDPLITLTILLILPVLAMLSFWGVDLEWRLLSLMTQLTLLTLLTARKSTGAALKTGQNGKTVN